jgi:hypothetical protein
MPLPHDTLEFGDADVAIERSAHLHTQWDVLRSLDRQVLVATLL